MVYFTSKISLAYGLLINTTKIDVSGIRYEFITSQPITTIT